MYLIPTISSVVVVIIIIIISLLHYLMVLYQLQILYGVDETVTMLCMVGERVGTCLWPIARCSLVFTQIDLGKSYPIPPVMIFSKD